MKEPIGPTRRALGLRAYLNLALAVTVVIFALASVFTYTQVERRIRAEVEERLDTLTSQVTRDTIGTWLGQKRNLAKALAAYPAMREMQVEEAQRIINATYAAAPADYNNIGFFDATGLMVADIAGGAGKGNLIKGNPWGQEVYAGRRTQSPELMSSLNNRSIFVLYERVMDASGRGTGCWGPSLAWWSSSRLRSGIPCRRRRAWVFRPGWRVRGRFLRRGWRPRGCGPWR